MLSMRNDPRPARLEIITNCGPADGTFDPSITTSYSTTITCDYGDGTQETLTGTAHNFSHTYAAAGPHRVIFRGAPLSAITAIDARNDLVSCSLAKFAVAKNLTYLVVRTNPTLTGDLGSLSGHTKLVNLYLDNSPNLTGNLSVLSGLTNLIELLLYGDSLIVAGSIATLVKMQDCRLHSMGWNQASVDLVIASAWGARAAYNYNGASMQIGGTNAAPSGNLIAPIEGSDWHNDGSKWVPLTGKAMIYDLLNDVNTEVFKKWSSISTS